MIGWLRVHMHCLRWILSPWRWSETHRHCTMGGAYGPTFHFCECGYNSNPTLMAVYRMFRRTGGR